MWTNSGAKNRRERELRRLVLGGKELALRMARGRRHTYGRHPVDHRDVHPSRCQPARDIFTASFTAFSATGKPRKRLPMTGSRPGHERRRSARPPSSPRTTRPYASCSTRRSARARSLHPARSQPSVSSVKPGRAGELVRTYGNVNRLRVKAGAKIDELCLKANAYEVRMRGPSGPVFGDLSVATVTTDDVAKVMASQPLRPRRADARRPRVRTLPGHHARDPRIAGPIGHGRGSAEVSLLLAIATTTERTRMPV
jgi:hypothetical protein